MRVKMRMYSEQNVLSLLAAGEDLPAPHASSVGQAGVGPPESVLLAHFGGSRRRGIPSAVSLRAGIFLK